MNLEDIAKLAGVSRSTVSRVVNNDPKVSDSVRARVQATIDTVGYRPNAAARALASRRSQAIGLVVPEDFSRHHVDAWYALIIESTLSAARDAGQSLMLIMEDAFSPNAGRRILSQFIDSGRVDGMLVLQHSYRDHLTGALLKAGVPVVHIAESDHPGTSWVDNDNFVGGRMVAERFKMAGVQRPLAVTATLEHVPSRRRLEGFRSVYPDATMLLTTHSLARAEDMLRPVIRGKSMDAVFAVNGWIAPVICRLASEYSVRIPRDLKVIAFDNFDAEYSDRAGLTTVVQHTSLLASRAVRLLIDRVEGRAPPGEHIVLDSVLIPRGSCDELAAVSMQGGGTSS